MTDIVPWLATMRAITGLTEYENGSNPKIEAMATYVGKKFPEQADYASAYTDDSIAWCGVCAAFCMATADISGPFGLTDTDKWMWALAWSDDANYLALGAPVQGAIVVMEREGGGHVCLCEEDLGNSVKCRGGNQSDAVTVATYDKDQIVGYFWPRSWPLPEVPRRTVSEGDKGADVAEIQHILGLPVDGDFGPMTDAQVKAFQGAAGLSKDGEVGPKTWEALDALEGRLKAGTDGISDELAGEIDDLVARSPVLNYSWPDRGKAPRGYIAGMAKCFAWALLRPSEPAIEVMSSAATNSEYDALNVYEEELNDEEIYVDDDGFDTLRGLFVLMIGLGMRESSGNHWCGRDMSASNVEAETCEAAHMQTSWNINTADPSIPPLLDEFWEDPNGFRPTFDQGVEPTASNLDAYGSGDGCRYQFLAKYSPNFHTLVTGVGLRKRSNHWGPINRGEVDIVGIVDDLLLEVQRVSLQQPVPPDPPDPGPDPGPGEHADVTIGIETEGDVDVTLTQDQTTKRRSKPAKKAQAKKKARPKKRGRR